MVCVLMWIGLLVMGSGVLSVVGGIYTASFADEKEKEDTYLQGWCEPFDYYFRDASCCSDDACWSCSRAYYHVYLYDFDPSLPSTSTSTSTSAPPTTTSTGPTTSEASTTDPTSSEASTTDPTYSEASTTSESPSTSTSTTPEPTTTTTTQDEYVPLSDDFLGKISIYYSTVTRETRALEKMEAKHPIGEVGECWYDPDDEDDDPRWRRPDADEYLVGMVVCWVVFFVLLIPVFVCCGVCIFLVCGVVTRNGCSAAWKRLSSCNLCGAFANCCSACNCYDLCCRSTANASNKASDESSNLYYFCCGGWSRFEDEDDDDPSGQFPL